MFEKLYPYLSSWICTFGWVEIGEGEFSSSMIRILNEGGLLWEDENSNTLDKALERAEYFLKNELPKEFGFELEIED